MKNLFLLLCSLLLNGVFGDTDEVKVSVKEGDSVTLKINPEDIKGATELVWKKNKSDIIGRLTVKSKHIEVYDTSDNIFRDRLKLNNQTGSLTITNIRAQHSGEYKLEIRSIRGIMNKTFSVSIIHEVKSVSVMEGDSYNLQTGVTDGQIDDVKWKLNGADLTDSNTEVNNQTGDLKITNIRRNQSGEYSVEINGFISHKTYSVAISGEVKKSVMKEHNGILHTDLPHLQPDDVIQWRFKDTLIAYSNKTTHNVPYNDADGRLTGRLFLDRTGSLIITNFRSEDSGLYDVNITGSKPIYIKFDVTESIQRSNGEKTGPGLLLVLILMGIFVIG